MFVVLHIGENEIGDKYCVHFISQAHQFLNSLQTYIKSHISQSHKLQLIEILAFITIDLTCPMHYLCFNLVIRTVFISFHCLYGERKNMNTSLVLNLEYKHFLGESPVLLTFISGKNKFCNNFVVVGKKLSDLKILIIATSSMLKMRAANIR